MKVVITSVGSLVGKGILDAVEDRRAGLEIVGTNSIADTHGNFRCERTYLVPAAAREAEYESRLVEIFDLERPDVVLPGRDDDVVALARIKEHLGAMGSGIAVGPVRLALLVNDKWSSHQFALEHGLPFADSARADHADEVAALVGRHGYPLIAKPRRGNGSRGVRIIFNETQLKSIQRHADYLLQCYLRQEPELRDWSALGEDGIPLFHAPAVHDLSSMSVLGPDGVLRGTVVVEVEHVMGQVKRMSRLDSTEVVSAVKRWTSALASKGWVGPMSLQGRIGRDGRFQGFELNGRLTGRTGMRTILGFDEVGVVLEAFTGRSIPPLRSNVATLIETAPSGFSVPESDAQRLAETGIWTRP